MKLSCYLIITLLWSSVAASQSIFPDELFSIEKLYSRFWQPFQSYIQNDLNRKAVIINVDANTRIYRSSCGGTTLTMVVSREREHDSISETISYQLDRESPIIMIIKRWGEDIVETSSKDLFEFNFPLPKLGNSILIQSSSFNFKIFIERSNSESIADFYLYGLSDQLKIVESRDDDNQLRRAQWVTNYGKEPWNTFIARASRIDQDLWQRSYWYDAVDYQITPNEFSVMIEMRYFRHLKVYTGRILSWLQMGMRWNHLTASF